MEQLLGVLAVFALVLTNGFFVAAEFSLVSVRHTRITQLIEEGNKAALATRRAIDSLDSYIAATQLGITLASLALGWIGEPAVATLFEPILRLIPGNWVVTVAHSLSIALAFSLVTALHIILGELVPKSIALQRAESVALMVAQPITAFHLIFRPVIQMMNGLGNWIVRAIGFQPAGSHSNVHSPEELEMLVHASKEAGLLQESEERLLRRVFDFSEVQARQVMKPRTEVDAVDVNTPLPDLLKHIAASHYSRYPVYEKSIDTVIGVLYTKDLLDTIGKQPQLLTNGATLKLATVLRTPLFFPESVGVDDVLDRMQKSKMHIGIVIDEYGGMSGVVTMEDILEELIGDVQDEFDVETNAIETRGGKVIVDGLVSLTEASERFGEPEGEVISTTVGGYVAERLDRIPEKGDVVKFGEYDLRVEEMDGFRVAKVRFVKRASPPPKADVAADKKSE